MPIKRGKIVRGRSAAPNYTWCTRSMNRTSLCFRLCRPVAGKGECGRIAGHALLGRTQLAILESRRRQRAAASDAPDPGRQNTREVGMREVT
jgi:hypothetical protein